MISRQRFSILLVLSQVPPSKMNFDLLNRSLLQSSQDLGNEPRVFMRTELLIRGGQLFFLHCVPAFSFQSCDRLDISCAHVFPILSPTCVLSLCPSSPQTRYLRHTLVILLPQCMFCIRLSTLIFLLYFESILLAGFSSSPCWPF